MTPSDCGEDMGRRTILFIDEIHRFNKAQQDAFLPLRRAWRHYPHRRRRPPRTLPLRRRRRCFPAPASTLCAALTVPEIVTLLQTRSAVWWASQAPEELLEQIAIYSNGDARQAYNTLEVVAAASAGKRADPRRRRRRHEPQNAALRQGRRRALQRDFRAA